jgi:hypothetical protein
LLHGEQSGVGPSGLGLELVEVVEATLDTEVVGGVDHGLDAQCPTILQVLLDEGVPVVDVHAHVDAAGHDPGAERAFGVGGDLTSEDDPNLRWAANPDVVGHHRFEERPPPVSRAKRISP